MRRVSEVREPFDETKGCDCDICNTKRLIWLMMRLLIAARRRRSFRLKERTRSPRWHFELQKRSKECPKMLTSEMKVLNYPRRTTPDSSA